MNQFLHEHSILYISAQQQKRENECDASADTAPDLAHKPKRRFHLRLPSLNPTPATPRRLIGGTE